MSSRTAETNGTFQGGALAGLRAMLDESERRRVADASRYANLDPNQCQLCGAEGEDKRSLFVSCFYAVHEVVPEAIDLYGVGGMENRGYYLRLCKSCRGRFLTMMGDWRKACVALRGVPKDHDGHPEDEGDPEATIPVRVNGAIAYITPDEWERRAALASLPEEPK